MILTQLNTIIVTQFSSLALVLAQAIQEPDILGDIQNTFNNFVQTGQIWALILGFFIGYFFRGMTSYN